MRSIKSLVVLAAVSGLFAGCGLNPWGAGQSGFKLFAALGKAVQKPSAIDDQKNNKQAVKSTLTTGVAKRLAKSAGRPVDTWRDTGYIAQISGNRYIYREHVTNKPSDEDPENLQTGWGEVEFAYNGDPNVAWSDANITDVYVFRFVGRENKTWKDEVDSLRLSIEFAATGVGAVKPGATYAWGRNITGDIAKGDGDTACFFVDSLNEVDSIQYGEGHFLDAHSGNSHDGDPYSFDFGIEVWHMGTYADYTDNQGVITFLLPWGETGKNLHFMIHFHPNYRRTGEIRESGPNGTLRVEFDWNEKSNSGAVTYYDEDGKVVETEN